MNNFLATSIDEPHLAEFKASAIAEDIIELNFRSWNPSNENDLDEVFTLLVLEPRHQNNGTLAGLANKQLANTLRSGGWIFVGYKGISVKPNSPRKSTEGKIIKMECGDGEIMSRICLERSRKTIGEIESRLCTLI